MKSRSSRSRSWAKRAALLLAAAAITAAPISSQAVKPQGQIIAIFGNASIPAFATPRVVVFQGSIATFRNLDVVAHDVVSTTGLFQTPLLGLKGTYSIGQIAFLPPGTYPFYCSAHLNMKGQLIIRKQL